jgi:FkbM family methyltransferase
MVETMHSMKMRLSDNIRRCLRQLSATCRRAFGGAAKIEAGPAKGMRFDAGPDNPRFVAGDYERPIQEVLASMVRPGDVCYDVGANLGFFSALLGRLAGEAGMVYAFEPVPKNASAVERNAALNGLQNIKVMKIALSNRSGTQELLLAQHVGGAVLKSVGTPPPDPAGSVMVETASVDRLIEQGHLRPPDIVKIDVEGAEMEVLYGMEIVLRDWAPTLILELDDETAAGCERKIERCQSFFQNFGYTMEPLPDSYPDGRWFVRHFRVTKDAAQART